MKFGLPLADPGRMKIHRKHENGLKLYQRDPTSTLLVHVPPFRFRFEMSGPISSRGRRTVLVLVFRKLRELYRDLYKAEIQHARGSIMGGLFPIPPISFRETPNLDTQLGKSGYALRYWRHKNRLSLREVAELSGLDLNNISRIERGKVHPRRHTLQRIEAALARYEEEGIICLSGFRTRKAEKKLKSSQTGKPCPGTAGNETALPLRESPGDRKLDALSRMWAAQLALSASIIDSDPPERA